MGKSKSGLDALQHYKDSVYCYPDYNLSPSICHAVGI